MKNNMFKALSFSLIAAFLFSCDAIKNANNTQKGAVIGAAGGAVIGGVIGNNTGSKDNSALGAIIGGVVGGAAGGYIGNRMDRQAERIETEIPGAEVVRVGEGISVTFDEKSGVYFDTNKSAINAASTVTLNKLAAIFKDYPNSNILIEGHTDSTGADDYNMTLSQRRAQSVAKYLGEKGLDTGRFTTAWYGETQPKYDNTTAEGRSKNRRVELAIVANEALKQEAIEKTKG
jgi:outer membrane protein OmpA-like peptidoglycan-associated protein